MKTYTATACGRVNLIGEHTDYNDGWVLPTAIPQQTIVQLTPRQDKRVHGISASFENASNATNEYILGEEKLTHSWIDYLQAVTHVLAQKNHRISGFDIHIASNIPVGSGLSSSAALEVAVLKALRDAFLLHMTDIEIAQIGQLAENSFIGARVGIMDQMACCLAHQGQALFLDTKTLKYEQISLNSKHMDLLVINSGIVHQHAGGEYNQRRHECEQACELLGIQKLRELTVTDLPRLEDLPDVLKRRARHVITENDRVHKAVVALRSGDMATLGGLLYESHLSMRKDYEVSTPEIDLLVDLCEKEEGIYGARLTGGGFGGCIVAVTKPGYSLEKGLGIVDTYSKAVSHQAAILVSSKYAPPNRQRRQVTAEGKNNSRLN